MDLKERVKTLPVTSGVYLFKDASSTVIYIGKAVNLRKRVESYFRKNTANYKTDVLVRNITDIDFIRTASEAEALLLEASLVKQYQPKYNVELKDDKSYPYIQITREPFPLVSIVRPHTKRGSSPNVKKMSSPNVSVGDPIKADFYGPYVEVTLVREALQILRKILKFRSCEPFANKICLDYHIGLCQGPCEKKVSKEEYNRDIRSVRLILEGKKDTLYKYLHAEMEAAAREKDFEAAAQLRDQIRAIGALYSGTRDVNYFKEGEQLQRAFGLERTPARIECFDISNIMGEQAVGSMVSFLNGKPDKNNYRRFKIKTVKGIDDFQMIAEVVRRRYKRLKEEGASYPDLIVIDGGKGQLAAAVKELKELDVVIPIVSLAKREEEVFMQGKRASIRLAADSLGLKLLQRVRDEAHRFGLKYHRLLRGKDMIHG